MKNLNNERNLYIKKLANLVIAERFLRHFCCALRCDNTEIHRLLDDENAKKELLLDKLYSFVISEDYFCIQQFTDDLEECNANIGKLEFIISEGSIVEANVDEVGGDYRKVIYSRKKMCEERLNDIKTIKEAMHSFGLSNDCASREVLVLLRRKYIEYECLQKEMDISNSSEKEEYYEELQEQSTACFYIIEQLKSIIEEGFNNH